MNLNIFLHAMREGGDCYINYVSPISKKIKYHIGTNNFSREQSPYIASKLASRGKISLEDNQVLVFCYDLDDFKILELDQITSIQALNLTVKQPFNG